MKPRAFFTLFQLAAGCGDLATGLLLLFAPALTLRWMGIERIPSDLVLVSFIGAFVFSVGLGYLIFLRVPRNAQKVSSLRALWLLTGIERTCVAFFVAVACLSQRLDPAWLIVSVVDFSFAVLQFTALRRNFLESLP